MLLRFVILVATDFTKIVYIKFMEFGGDEVIYIKGV